MIKLLLFLTAISCASWSPQGLHSHWLQLGAPQPAIIDPDNMLSASTKSHLNYLTRQSFANTQVFFFLVSSMAEQYFNPKTGAVDVHRFTDDLITLLLPQPAQRQDSLLVFYGIRDRVYRIRTGEKTRSYLTDSSTESAAKSIIGELKNSQFDAGFRKLIEKLAGLYVAPARSYSSNSAPNNSSSGEGSSAGLIIFLIIAGIAIYFIYKKFSEQGQTDPETDYPAGPNLHQPTSHNYPDFRQSTNQGYPDLRQPTNQHYSDFRQTTPDEPLNSQPSGGLGLGNVAAFAPNLLNVVRQIGVNFNNPLNPNPTTQPASANTYRQNQPQAATAQNEYRPNREPDVRQRQVGGTAGGWGGNAATYEAQDKAQKAVNKPAVVNRPAATTNQATGGTAGGWGSNAATYEAQDKAQKIISKPAPTTTAAATDKPGGTAGGWGSNAATYAAQDKAQKAASNSSSGNKSSASNDRAGGTSGSW